MQGGGGGEQGDHIVLAPPCWRLGCHGGGKGEERGLLIAAAGLVAGRTCCVSPAPPPFIHPFRAVRTPQDADGSPSSCSSESLSSERHLRKPPLLLIPHLQKKRKQNLIRRLLTQNTILNILYKTDGHSGFSKMIKAKLGKQTFG